MYNWDEIVGEFMIEMQIKGFSELTIQNYHYKLKKCKLFFQSQGIKYIDTITKQNVKKLILWLQNEGLQASSINSILCRLIKLFDYMVEEEYILQNPCEKVKKLRMQKKIVYPLNDHEIKQMLAIARQNRNKEIGQRNVTMLSLMLDAGLRINEVMSLKTEDILENQILIRNAKGNKDRAVALTPILKKEMRKYKRLKDKTKHKDCKYFFVSQRGGKGTTKIGIEIMQEIKKQMTIRSVVRFSPHTLRHTYAHMQMRNGMDIYTLSKNMGHSSVTMTQNYLQTLKSDDFVKESIKYSTLQNLR